VNRKILFALLLIWIQVASALAQSSLNPFVVEDDTLPIANSRFDDAIELPQENFTSPSKNDMWEKFERGDLGGEAYAELQKDYQKKTAKSKVVTGRDLASVKSKKTQVKKQKVNKKPTSVKSRKSQSIPKNLPPKKKNNH
jgi:hypothetical protein